MTNSCDGPLINKKGEDAMVWKKIKEILHKDRIRDMTENDFYYILRESKRITFLNKKTLETEHVINIGFDNEFGFKHIAANNDMYITVVYKKSRSDEDPCDPYKATLVAYDTNGERWSYPLKGWTLTVNYGGFYIIEDSVVFHELGKNGARSVILDITSGKKKIELPSAQYMDTSYNQMDSSLSLAFENKIIYSIHKEGFVLKELFHGSLIEVFLLNKDPDYLVQNQDSVFFYFLDDKGAKIIIMDKENIKIKKEIVLRTDKISSLYPANNDKNLIINQDKSNKISCYDIEKESVIWEHTSEEEGVPFQVYDIKIDKNDFVHVFSEYPDERVRIFNIKDGSIIQEITGEESPLITPIFTMHEKLFIQDWEKLYCYVKES
jgi:hypothetical protein